MKKASLFFCLLIYICAFTFLIPNIGISSKKNYIWSNAGIVLAQTASGSNASTIPPASDSDASEPEQKQPSKVIAVNHPEYDLEHMPKIRILQNDAANVDELLYFVLYFGNISLTIEEPDGSISTKQTSVNWDITGMLGIDTMALGTHTEIGTIALPVGDYVFADGVLQQIELPVEIYVPEEPFRISHVDSVYDNFHYSIAILPGGNLYGQLAQYSENVYYYQAGTDSVHIGSIVWDTDSVLLDTPGFYEIEGSFQLPMHCVFDESAHIPSLKLLVIVQEPNKPEIPTYCLQNFGLRFPWVLSREHVDLIHPWISENGGPWIELVNENLTCWNVYELVIDHKFLKKGSAYRLQIDYEDGQTGILHFVYDDPIVVTDYLSGDRDGGDTDGKLPVYPPVQTPDDDDSQEPEESKPLEPDTDDSQESEESKPLEPDDDSRIPADSKPSLPDVDGSHITAVPKPQLPNVDGSHTATESKPQLPNVDGSHVIADSEPQLPTPDDSKNQWETKSQEPAESSAQTLESLETNTPTAPVTSEDSTFVTNHLGTITIVALIVAIVSFFLLIINKHRRDTNDMESS